jgi:hypothetical protein
VQNKAFDMILLETLPRFLNSEPTDESTNTAGTAPGSPSEEAKPTDETANATAAPAVVLDPFEAPDSDENVQFGPPAAVGDTPPVLAATIEKLVQRLTPYDSPSGMSAFCLPVLIIYGPNGLTD